MLYHRRARDLKRANKDVVRFQCMVFYVTAQLTTRSYACSVDCFYLTTTQNMSTRQLARWYLNSLFLHVWQTQQVTTC